MKRSTQQSQVQYTAITTRKSLWPNDASHRGRDTIPAPDDEQNTEGSFSINNTERTR